MESDDIRQMFADYGTLKKMGSFDPKYQETKNRYDKLRKAYMAEQLLTIKTLSIKTEPLPAEKQEESNWKGAMQYLAGILQQMDTAVPDSAATNRIVWDIVKTAVVAYYDKTEENNSENKQ